MKYRCYSCGDFWRIVGPGQGHSAGGKFHYTCPNCWDKQHPETPAARQGQRLLWRSLAGKEGK